jgi:hypothetical protein
LPIFGNENIPFINVIHMLTGIWGVADAWDRHGKPLTVHPLGNPENCGARLIKPFEKFIVLFTHLTLLSGGT